MAIYRFRLLCKAFQMSWRERRHVLTLPGFQLDADGRIDRTRPWIWEIDTETGEVFATSETPLVMPQRCTPEYQRLLEAAGAERLPFFALRKRKWVPGLIERLESATYWEPGPNHPRNGGDDRSDVLRHRAIVKVDSVTPCHGPGWQISHLPE